MIVALHHPPHLFIDDEWYFITAHTLGQAPVLKPEIIKQIIYSKLEEVAESLQLKINAYVILNDHYHLVLKFAQAKLIPVFMNQLHGSSSYLINKLENKTGRSIWHNYWDRVVRDERDFWTKFNYIHNNPVKHGYASSPEKWIYSSYQEYIDLKGEEWMSDCLQSYPILNYECEN